MIVFVATFLRMLKEKQYCIQGTVQLFILLLLFIGWFRFPSAVWEIEGFTRLEFE